MVQADDGCVFEDIEGLRLICNGMEMTTPRMREAAIQFAYDKYIRQPKRDAERALREAVENDNTSSGSEL